MPGRVAVRSAQPARPSKSRGSTRNTSPSDNIPHEGENTSLREELCAIFSQAHRTTTGTRKLIVTLRKIQEACCYEPAHAKKWAATEEFDENDFATEFLRCVVRSMQIKKSEPSGDRLVKFVGLFLKYAADADNAIFQTDDPQAAFPETPSSRLSSFIIAKLLPCLAAKDKVVRFRCTQIIAHLINTLDTIDDELFHPIRLGLLKRLRDKESQVRAQAVYGLGRLASESMDVDNNDDSDDDDVAGSVLEKLLDVLQNDPSGDVRRSLLLNLPFTPTTLPFLLERARDVDGPIRRALYSRLLPALADFRHLSLTHREKLLRWGLRDRDETVKKATARLFRERWIQDCSRARDDEGQPIELKPGEILAPSLTALLELLERIDIINSGNDGGIALDAMREFWDGRPDFCDFITFDEAYWTDLTPESVFLARTFNDFCRKEATSARLQEKLPEVSRFAFLLQQNINKLAEQIRKSALQEDTDEDTAQQEFIVEQLLQVALTLDYSDEIGRRTMFSLLREALALAELPEEATRLVTDVLRTASGTLHTSEKEFIAVVLEAIAEVHDTIMGEEPAAPVDEGDDSFHSARSEVTDDSTPRKVNETSSLSDEEKAVREIMVNMKCLHIAQCMLQNVDCELESNVDLVTMLNNLVIPAVRSQEAPIRERGLLCLGLCCLLDKNLAEENLTLFLHCFTKGHDALQNIAIQIIGDILCAHPLLVSKPSVPSEEATDEPHPLQKPIHKLFSKALDSPSAPIQTTACTALCKLMLASPTTTSDRVSVLDHDEFLRILSVAYFNPETNTNPALRQALSYFIPVYCHSRKENLERMGRIALDVLQWCISVKDEMDDDDAAEVAVDMVGLSVVIDHLVDWTDDRKLAAAFSGFGVQNDAKDTDGGVHIGMAKDILEKLLGVCSKEDRKLYISMLGKLHISPIGDVDKLGILSSLVDSAIDDKLATDATTRNTLSRVQTSLGKALKSKSRSRSVAASTMENDDENNEITVLDDETSDEPKRTDSFFAQEDVSATITPAVSPQKSRNSTTQQKQGRSRRTIASEPVSEADEPSEILDSSIDEVSNMMNVKEEPADDSDTPRAKRHTSVAEVTVEEDTLIESSISTPAPAYRPATVAVVEQTEPTKRPRGRPSRAAAAPPRKSVRSGRRAAASLATEESLLEGE